MNFYDPPYITGARIMRNLAKYPITEEEVIEAVTEAAIKAHGTSGIGGIQAAALIKAKADLKKFYGW